MSALKHRSDIEGLRALAVLPIVVFHAGVSALSGGFIGVDIFFVISGYLITSIILREIAEERFSIARFYHRRIVRIFPALFVLIAAVLVAGFLLMLPLEFADLGRSSAAAVGFLSNVYFWRTLDYFGSAAETQPLLHTWSLGVEEQFYILYPILLLLVFRWASHWLRAALILLAAVSFGVGAICAIRWPEAGFYLIPARGWELALGGLVAIGAFPQIASRLARQIAAAVGLLLILAGYLFIRSEMAFPVPWALLPCVGAAMLIAYGEGSAVGGIMSTGPLRFVGRISYSLYLWHWPLIAFYRLLTGVRLHMIEAAGLVAASFVAATLSYYLVEQPALRAFRSAPLRPVLVIGGGALLATAAGSLLLSFNADKIGFLPSHVRQIAAFEDYRATPYYSYQFRRGICFRTAADSDIPLRPECLRLSETKPDMVVLGDSHAAQYWRALSLRFPERNVIQATSSGCRPVIGGEGAPRCREIVDLVLGPMLDSGKIETIVLAGRWEPEDLPQIRPTLRRIREANTRVVLVGPGLEYQGSFPSILARAEWHRYPRSEVDELREVGPFEMNVRLRMIAQAENVPYVDVQKIVCPSGQCMLFEPNGAPMLFDSNHFTYPATRHVVRQMAEI